MPVKLFILLSNWNAIILSLINQSWLFAYLLLRFNNNKVKGTVWSHYTAKSRRHLNIPAENLESAFFLRHTFDLKKSQERSIRSLVRNMSETTVKRSRDPLRSLDSSLAEEVFLKNEQPKTFVILSQQQLYEVKFEVSVFWDHFVV